MAEIQRKIAEGLKNLVEDLLDEARELHEETRGIAGWESCGIDVVEFAGRCLEVIDTNLRYKDCLNPIELKCLKFKYLNLKHEYVKIC